MMMLRQPGVTGRFCFSPCEKTVVVVVHLDAIISNSLKSQKTLQAETSASTTCVSADSSGGWTSA